MHHQALFADIRDRIARDELPVALQLLRALLENTPRLNEILQQSGRLEHIRRQMRLGTVSHADAALEQNRIRHGVLELLSDIEQERLPPATLRDLLAAVEQESARPELRGEVEKAVSIVNSKNVVAGSSIAAGGDVRIGDDIHHHYGDKKIPRLLTNPPFNTELFIGREKDLNAIETEYQQHNRLLVLVNGEGGIGKTTLAARYWYAHAGRYQHLAWLYADTGIGAALVTLKEKLGVDFRPDDSLETQAARMAEAVNNLNAPCLLVFDNANDDADLKKHYALLNRLGNCHILLTSRVRKLAAMKVHEVKPLRETEAVALFRHYYPDIDEAEAPMLHDVLQAVGYNTLVTEVLAKNMAVFNRFARRYGVADLLRDLQAKGLLALKSKAVSVVYGSDTLREAAPQDIIAAMYDLTTLEEAERRLLSNLAVLPADNIPYTLLTTLLGTAEDELEAPLGSLEEKGWLEFRKSDNSFKISPVIQEVTRHKNADRLLDDCRTLIEHLRTGLDNDNRHIGNYRQAAVFARLGLAAIHALPIDDDVAILCQNIGNYHKDTGNLSLMLQSYQKMLDIQTALCAAEPGNAHFKNGLAISYSKLGDTHTAMGNLPQALTFFEDETRFFEELHETYPENVSFKNGLAISYSNLGWFYRDQMGDFEKAKPYFQKCYEIWKELSEQFSDYQEFKNNFAWAKKQLGY